jgi:hypothetical protein
VFPLAPEQAIDSVLGCDGDKGILRVWIRQNTEVRHVTSQKGGEQGRHVLGLCHHAMASTDLKRTAM